MRAVDGREEDGDEHQGERGGDGEVRVLLERAVVAQPGHDQDEEGHPEGRPAQLGARAALAGGGEVEPLDQDQAEAVEQHGDREQEGVRVRGPEAHGEVREQRGGGQARGVVGGGAGVWPVAARPT